MARVKSPIIDHMVSKPPIGFIIIPTPYRFSVTIVYNYI